MDYATSLHRSGGFYFEFLYCKMKKPQPANRKHAEKVKRYVKVFFTKTRSANFRKNNSGDLKKKLSRNRQPLIEKERIGTNRSKGERGKEG